ncbi:hypothetical protein M0R45_028234 [Rubus argutus]|uniref:Uncharacterized protein n=1 Tax=Rubus argutus TaxID=59490 RepID=A0AAW1W738_RUBAR
MGPGGRGGGPGGRGGGPHGGPPGWGGPGPGGRPGPGLPGFFGGFCDSIGSWGLLWWPRRASRTRRPTWTATPVDHFIVGQLVTLMFGRLPLLLSLVSRPVSVKREVRHSRHQVPPTKLVNEAFYGLQSGAVDYFAKSYGWAQRIDPGKTKSGYDLCYNRGSWRSNRPHALQTVERLVDQLGQGGPGVENDVVCRPRMVWLM